MATKLELLAILEEAGEDGYSMKDSKADLEDAVAALDEAEVERRIGV